MGLFDFLKGTDINQGYELYRRTLDAVLLDVRTPIEYVEGHISGSVNIPLDQIETAADRFQDLKVPLFVYCLRGSRSRQAVDKLKKMGYQNVRSIGEINAWHGEQTKGSM